MGGPEFRLVFDQDGYPRELISAADRNRAVAEEALTAETLVTIYREGSAPHAVLAGRIPELRDLFTSEPSGGGAAAVPAPATSASSASPADPEFVPTATGGSIAPANEDEPDVKFVLDDSDYEHSDELEHEEAPATSHGALRISGLLILIAVAGGFWLFNTPPESAEPPRQLVEFEVKGAANVRDKPTTEGSSIVGRLRRGDVLSGYADPGPGSAEWIHITEGKFSGSYVWRRNLLPRSERSAPVSVVSPNAKEVERPLSPCMGLSCRVVTEDGWAGIRAGAQLTTALVTTGFTLDPVGHYDEFFADEPGRLESCNIRSIKGAPSNLNLMVENGVITSLSVSLGNAGARFETDRRVALGDSESAVRKAYPKLRQEPNIYSSPPDKMLIHRGPSGKGIRFAIVKGKVAEIAFGGQSIEYVEGCL